MSFIKPTANMSGKLLFGMRELGEFRNTLGFNSKPLPDLQCYTHTVIRKAGYQLFLFSFFKKGSATDG